MKLYIAPLYSWLQHNKPLPLAAVQAIEEVTSYVTKNARFTKAFKKGGWDGKTHLGFSRLPTEDHPYYSYVFPTGLAPQVVWKLKKLERRDVLDPIDVINRRKPPESHVSGFRDVEGITLRPHQIRLIDSIMDPKKEVLSGLYLLDAAKTRHFYAGVGEMSPLRLQGSGIWWSSTGSGKTDASAALTGRLGVKTLFLVFGNSLVIQAYNRFRTRLSSWIQENDISLALCIEGGFATAHITFAGVTTLALHLNTWNRAIDDLKKHFSKMIEFFKDQNTTGSKEACKLLNLVTRALRREDRYLPERLQKLKQIDHRHLALSPKGQKLWDTMISKFDFYLTHQKTYKAREEQVKEYLNSVDLLILDEAHGASADTTYDILANCPAYYRVAMSGTPLDRDESGNLKVLSMFGDVSERVTNKEMLEAGYIPPATINMIKVEHEKLEDISSKEWALLYTMGITEHVPRNEKIVRVIEKAYHSEQNVLLIFRTIDHGDILHAMLTSIQVPTTVISGEDKIDRREVVLDQFKAGQIKVLLASDIFGTGIDLPTGVDVLILAAGGKATVSILQKLGRGLRGDTPVEVYDFIDHHHPTLLKHSRERYKIYKQQGCFNIKREHGQKKLF